MVGCFSCFGNSSLVPPDHTELTRAELKALYEKSLAANNGRLIVHGIFARADTRNNNKRVYPKHILKREVAKFEQEHIANGTALGELDHPNYASQYFKCLNLPNASHQVLEVHWKGDQLWGTIEILATPSGLLLWELYSQGIRLGVSSRGWASLRTDPKLNVVYVDDDFELITFDFVTEPSTKDAYLVPVRKTYKHKVTDQRRRVQISHLGHGVVSMRNIHRLPDAQVLVQRINQLQAADPNSFKPPASAATAGASYAGGQQQPTTHKVTGLDKLLFFSHYIVYPDAPYLDREQHARDYGAHLATFAMRAHLSDQQQLVNRSDLNAIIMHEITKEEETLRKQRGEDAMLSPSQDWGHQSSGVATASTSKSSTGSSSVDPTQRGGAAGSSGRAGAGSGLKAGGSVAVGAGMLPASTAAPGPTRFRDAECQGAMGPGMDLGGGAWSMHNNPMATSGSGQSEAEECREGALPGSCECQDPAGASQASLPYQHSTSIGLLGTGLGGGAWTPEDPSTPSYAANTSALHAAGQRASSSNRHQLAAVPPSAPQAHHRGGPGQASGFMGQDAQASVSYAPPPAAPAVPGVSNAVAAAAAAELQLIRGTLERYAKQYQVAQDALQMDLRVQLPTRQSLSVAGGGGGGGASQWR